MDDLYKNNKLRIIFDAGPIISLSINGILDILGKLKELNPNISFVIPYGVKEELIDKPLITKKFKFEALKILNLIENNIIEVLSEIDADRKKELMRKMDIMANQSLVKRCDPNFFITILHKGELELFAEMIINNINYAIIDENIARKIIENPTTIKNRIEKKTHESIRIVNNSLKDFNKLFDNETKIFRSSEFVTICYEKNLFKDYESSCYKQLTNIVNIKAEVLEALLLALRESGCAIFSEEIYKIMNIEKIRNAF